MILSVSFLYSSEIISIKAYIQKPKVPKPEVIVEAKTPPVEKEKNVIDLINEGEKGDKIVFNNILFKTGYASVTPDSKKTHTQMNNCIT